MKTIKVTCDGNVLELRNFSRKVNVNSERRAVEKVYASRYEGDCFPKGDSRIFDCDGNLIADANDDCIRYENGYFVAEEIEDNIELDKIEWLKNLTGM